MPSRRLIASLLLVLAATAVCVWYFRPAPQPVAAPVTVPVATANPETPKPAWHRWGGALNSAESAGDGFFDRARARRFLKDVPPPDRRYVVELAARSFVPEATAEALGTLLGDAAETIVYLQFHEHPTPEQRTELAAQKIELIQYMAGYAWTARVSRAALTSAFKLPYVRAAAGVDARDKLHIAVFRGRTPDFALAPDGRTRFMVLTQPGTALEAMTAHIKPESIAAAPVSVLGPRFEIVAPASDALALAALPQTAFVEYVPPAVASRDAITDEGSNVVDVRDGGLNLNGSGIKVAVRELGKPDDHVDYDGRMSFVDTTGKTDSGNVNHATAVSGQIGGSGAFQPTAKGVAPAVSMLYYAVADQSSSFFTTDVTDAGTRGARISNHSYGPTGLVQWGDYQTVSADWDSALRTNNLLATFAGNEESGNIFKHIDFFVGMKNGICVGAASSSANAGDDNPPAAKSDGIASFSEFGPMNDGRVKPDLVAFGQSVQLLRGTNGISTASGTSFSTPAVSGVAALVFQHYKNTVGTEPSAALAKAILCNSATDLGNEGPDGQYGFGIVNAEGAANIISLRTSITNSPFFEGSLTDGKTSSFTVNVPQGANLRVTLCWLDNPGQPAAAKALVNDLDLEVESPTGTIFRPYMLDPANAASPATKTGPNNVDPIEQTVVTNADAGTWTVRIKATSVPQGDQPFSVCLNLPKEPSAVTATVLASPTTGPAPLVVSFSGALSPGQITSYSWTFGDGATGSGAEVEHTYTSPGSYTATLTVMDNLQRQSSASVLIVVTKRQARAFGAKSAASINFTKPDSDKLTFSILSAELALTPQAAKDALKNGQFEGKTYAIRVGGQMITSGIADRKASFSTKTTKFKINPAKGEIKVSLSNKDLSEVFAQFGMTADPDSNGLHTLPVELETDDAIFLAPFLFNYTTSGSSGKAKGL